MLVSVLGYIDPGSGGLILQLLLGGFAAAGVALRLWWSRVLRFLRIRKDDPEPAPAAAAAEPAPTGAREAAAQPDR